MSDGDTMLTCFGYFLDCPRLCLIRTRGVKSVANAKSATTIDISVGSISAGVFPFGILLLILFLVLVQGYSV